MKHKFLFLLGLMLCCTLSTFAQKDVYLFSYFKGNGEDGLHLAYSYDGKNWQTLNNDKSLLHPKAGNGKLMRDPSITQNNDGTYHMVWTTGWWDQGIGYSSSKDLIHWSEQQNIPVMQNFPTAKNTWAPEIFFDKKSKTFYIFWSSTVPSDTRPATTKFAHHFHCQYYVTTKDFKTFSPTKVFFDPEFSVIDGAILKRKGKYYFFLKNENDTPAEKNIRIVSNKKPYGFSTDVSAPITGKYWSEGPTPLVVGDYIYVYFDKYMEGKYGAIRSKDMKNWEDVSDMVSFPKGIRHGTAFKVPKSVLDNLLKLSK